MSNTATHGEVFETQIWRWAVPVAALSLMGLLWLTGSNAALFLAINHASTVMGDTFWSHVTVLGDAAIFLLILLFCGRRPHVVWQFFIAGILAIAWTQSLKSPLGVLRPPGVLDPGQFHLIGYAFQYNAFPSGHTTSVFVVVAVLCLQKLPAPIKVGLLSLAVLVGFSRIACGVHWPLDVLGGVLGGWLAALAGNWIGQRWEFGLHRYMQQFFAILLLGIACWMLFRTVEEFAITAIFQKSIAVVALAFSSRPVLRLFGMGR